MISREEFQHKLDRLKQALSSSDHEAIVLRQHANVSWLTGIRTHVSFGAESSIVTIVVTPTVVHAIAGSNEARRLREEEAPNLDLNWLEFPWSRPGDRESLIAQVGSDDTTDEQTTAPLLLALRTQLCVEELDRMDMLGWDATHVTESVARSITPGTTEYEVAGHLAQQLLAIGIEPMVLLVAADDRTMLRPHPLPTHLPIWRLAMIAVCVRRGGLYVSLTRYITFCPLSDTEAATYQDVSELFTLLQRESRPGVRLRELWKRLTEAYTARDMPHGWERHHQGGISGYAPREVLLAPDASHTACLNSVVAYNPSHGLWKSEDTGIITATGVKLITQSQTWPTVRTADGFDRPGVLVLDA